jgi:hypothetical protein
MADRIAPKNLTAQLAHRPQGNPPGALVSSSVGNYYPGLELDLRNLWRRLFVGVEFHEGVAIVVAVDAAAPPEVQAVNSEILLTVDGHPIWIEVKGPRTVDGASEVLDHWSLEWSNALADVVPKAGSKVPCVFTKGNAGEQQEVALEVRPVFESTEAGQTAMLNRALAGPGELTQSLCSPWQNDFVGCGCYYWAASRPDYVNVEPEGPGASRGHNWLQRDRTAATPKTYTLRRADLLQHEDIIQSWEDKLQFVLGGHDER